MGMNRLSTYIGRIYYDKLYTGLILESDQENQML